MSEQFGLYKWAVMTMCVLTLPLLAPAATVSIQDDMVEVGFATTTTLQVLLTNDAGDQVAGAQWDLVFDPDRFTLGVVTTGSAAAAAGKSVSSTILSPGVIRVLVSGMTVGLIPDGVLATVPVTIPAGTVSGDYVFELSGLVLSNFYGIEVDSVADPGALTVVALQLPASGVLTGPILLALLCVFLGVFYLRTMRDSRCVK